MRQRNTKGKRSILAPKRSSGAVVLAGERKNMVEREVRKRLLV